jgi:hypothetical protein
MKGPRTQTGGALMGIIIIIIILALGGVYIWKMTQKRVSDNLATQKALQDQSASVQDTFGE